MLAIFRIALARMGKLRSATTALERAVHREGLARALDALDAVRSPGVG